ncbi:MAG: hypothetical protein ACO3NL_07825, partial [Phycisphaerales bacterium]
MRHPLVILALIASTLGLGQLAHGDGSGTRRRVVVCTDLAMGLDCTNVFGSPPSAADPDDAWALAWALNNPTWEVIGVV